MASEQQGNPFIWRRTWLQQWRLGTSGKRKMTWCNWKNFTYQILLLLPWQRSSQSPERQRNISASWDFRLLMDTSSQWTCTSKLQNVHTPRCLVFGPRCNVHNLPTSTTPWWERSCKPLTQVRAEEGLKKKTQNPPPKNTPPKNTPQNIPTPWTAQGTHSCRQLQQP